MVCHTHYCYDYRWNTLHLIAQSTKYFVSVCFPRVSDQKTPGYRLTILIQGHKLTKLNIQVYGHFLPKFRVHVFFIPGIVKTRANMCSTSMLYALSIIHHHHHIHFRALFSSTEGWAFWQVFLKGVLSTQNGSEGQQNPYLASFCHSQALHPMISLPCQIFSVQPHSACVLLQSSLCCALHVKPSHPTGAEHHI